MAISTGNLVKPPPRHCTTLANKPPLHFYFFRFYHWEICKSTPTVTPLRVLIGLLLWNPPRDPPTACRIFMFSVPAIGRSANLRLPLRILWFLSAYYSGIRLRTTRLALDLRVLTLTPGNHHALITNLHRVTAARGIQDDQLAILALLTILEVQNLTPTLRELVRRTCSSRRPQPS